MPPEVETDTQAEELAALEDGFTSDEELSGFSPADDEEPTETLEDSAQEETETTEPEAPAQETAPAPAAPATPSPFEAQLADLRAVTRRELDTAFGKLGGVERTLKELREQTGRAPSLNGSLTTDDFKMLNEEWPEIAARVVEGFNAGLKRIMTAAPPPAPAPTAQPPASPQQGRYVTQEDLEEQRNQQAQAIREEVKRDTATQFLDYMVPDWRTITGKPNEETPYRKWMATQPVDYQRKIADSWNPVEIIQSIKQFQKFQASQTEPPKPNKIPQKPKPSVRQQVVKAAVPPQGTRHTERTGILTEEEGLEAGFNE